MTGTLFAPVLGKMIERFNERFGTALHVAPVVNDYFGGDVSVAGLLTGRDLLAARQEVRGEFVIVPRVVLKSNEPIMLDGMRFDELQQQFDVPVHAFDFSQFATWVREHVSAKAF